MRALGTADVPNLVVAPVNADHLDIYRSGGPVDVVIDVAGWFGEP